MVHFREKDRYDYGDLLEIIRILRSPEGCPWDQVQTHASIRRGLLEEAYEAAEAIDRDDAPLLQEELGDVLMQVVFHADIERQRGRFTMEDVVDGEVRKLLFRHPHVFGSAAPEKDAESVLVSWDAIKAARFAGVDPEDALNAACEKFIRRYAAVEQGAAGRGVPVSDLTLAEMTDLWNGAKQRHDSDGF